jgi:hypothetical protein
VQENSIDAPAGDGEQRIDQPVHAATLATALVSSKSFINPLLFKTEYPLGGIVCAL